MPYSDNLKVFWFTPMRAATRSCEKIMEHLDFKEFSHDFLKNKLHERVAVLLGVNQKTFKLSEYGITEILIGFFWRFQLLCTI